MVNNRVDYFGMEYSSGKLLTFEACTEATSETVNMHSSSLFVNMVWFMASLLLMLVTLHIY